MRPALLELDGGAGLLEFSFELVGLLALDALFDCFRSLVDDRLGLFETETGCGADDLDHGDFLSADLGQDDIHSRGLFGSAALVATTGSGGSRGRDGGRGDAELLLERFD